MPELVAPVAACSNELRLIPEPDVDDEAPNALDSSEFSDDTEPMRSVPRTTMIGTDKIRRNGFYPLRRAELLQKLQHCLLSLVCLLQRSHTRRLQDVVLRHVAHGLAHIRIHDAIGS